MIAPGDDIKDPRRFIEAMDIHIAHQRERIHSMRRALALLQLDVHRAEKELSQVITNIKYASHPTQQR